MTERDDLNQETGAIREGLDIARSVFERELTKLEQVLEDKSWRKLGFGGVEDYLASIDFGNLRILADDRKRLVALIKGAEPVSNRKIAKAIGVDERTVRRDIEPVETSAANAAEPDMFPEGESNTNAAIAAPAAAQRTADERKRIVASHRPRAERKAGQLLAEMEKAKGAENVPGQKGFQRPSDRPRGVKTLEELLNGQL
jgi:hypothetical protein